MLVWACIGPSVLAVGLVWAWTSSGAKLEKKMELWQCLLSHALDALLWQWASFGPGSNSGANLKKKNSTCSLGPPLDPLLWQRSYGPGSNPGSNSKIFELRQCLIGPASNPLLWQCSIGPGSDPLLWQCSFRLGSNSGANSKKKKFGTRAVGLVWAWMELWCRSCQQLCLQTWCRI